MELCSDCRILNLVIIWVSVSGLGPDGRKVVINRRASKIAQLDGSRRV